MGKQLITVEMVRYGQAHTSQVYYDGAAYRWATNGAVVPLDAADEYGVVALPGYDARAQKAARDRDTDRVVATYRANRARNGYSSEELAEMRAAFGPGATVVDVLTGKRVAL